MIGNGAAAQLTLGNMHNETFGNFLSIAFGNGFALFIGLTASIPLSGGHLNPAVTLGFAMLKKCTWRQVNITILKFIFLGVSIKIVAVS